VRGVQLRRLRLDDLDWENERIHFSAAKGGNPLGLPLTADAGNAILEHLQNGRPNEAPYAEVFLQSRPPFRPFRWSGSFSNIVSRRLRQAGIEPPEGVSRGLHSFRHAFASRLTGRVPFKHIADLLGHRDLGSTFIYTKVDFRGLAETALPWPEEDCP
jgi:integrase/recombinase XerD